MARGCAIISLLGRYRYDAWDFYLVYDCPLLGGHRVKPAGKERYSYARKF